MASGQGFDWAALKSAMTSYDIDFYWVPAEDRHFNEYRPACWQRRSWVSGFSGSAGALLLSPEQGWLWTDGRYFLQAQQQLDAQRFELMRQGIEPSVLVWLAQHGSGKRVGLDPWCMSLAQRDQWYQQSDRIGFEIKWLPTNVVDELWLDQPPLPAEPITVLDIQYSGQAVADKCEQLRLQMAQKGVDYHIINSLDSIAWLLNLRGQDVPCNPVFLAQVLVGQESLALYAQTAAITDEVRQHLEAAQVEVYPYADFAAALPALQGQVWLDPECTPVAVAQALTQAELVFAASPLLLSKAVKNTVELAGMAEAHRLDGLALVRFLVWLEAHWQDHDEVSAAAKLAELRAAAPSFRGLSFDTICGYADHGAIIHYKAESASAHRLGDESLLLLDSGAQYLCGTTDVTRTLHLGQPTEGQRHHYTLVLKGHLALRQAVFVAGTAGEHLDAVARLPLWREFLQYGHGTGHGVGCYLNVHEGPQSISGRLTGVPLVPGMVVSNEPGVYFPGQYGIRIENLVAVTALCEPEDSPTGHGPFYGFYDLTLVPYARNLIEPSLLSVSECKWINDYHQQVFDALQADLNVKERAWLQQATAPLLLV
jgi:Xaa-Pro aminopeptidase